MACKKLPCTCQYNIPRCPSVSMASFKEQSHGEASPSPTPSSEGDNTSLIFTVGREINKEGKETPTQTRNSPVLEQQMTKKPIGSYSVYPVHLEAIGTHIHRHVRTKNQPSRNSKRDTVPPGPAAGPSTVIRLCRRSQTPVAPSRVSRSSSEPQVEERMAVTVGALANPGSQSGLWGAPGNPLGRGTVAMAPEMLPKHPHLSGKSGPSADTSLPGDLAGAPLSQLAGAPPHLPPRRFIKAWSCPLIRPPQSFQTACSQAPPRPGVNAH
ncbi:uncharacterized protein C12orf42 homolog [Pteronotus mesoamericanus]|uniref:uncharacterized protein C12orf42 homolog n=1 Tax=Pteronotus mesoamericanus TaxID=1884717 RepID=UPI0023ED7205|nr:uncharacterized protein C12orf42 homolog [Pteronotus parnellii mesoamericanus]